MGSPLQNFKQQHEERWTALQDIPVWEGKSILRWVRRVFTDDGELTGFRAYIISQIEIRHRLHLTQDLKIQTTSWTSLEMSITRMLSVQNYEPFLIFLDCLVQFVRDQGENYTNVHGYVYFNYGQDPIKDVLSDLEKSLANGSKWAVVFDKGANAGIVERVDEHLMTAAKSLKSEHLTKAWNEAFAVKTKAEKAVSHAQNAIEEIASKKGLITTPSKVYGALLGDIRKHPDKYISAAESAYNLSDTIGKDPREPLSANERFSNWFWTGMDLIQKAHPTRHASTATQGFSIDADTAKQAVLIATLLCQLMDSGYFKKIDSDTKSNNAQSK